MRMETAVARRMRFPNVSRTSMEWRDVEDQEIQRFMTVLGVRIANHEDKPASLSRWGPTVVLRPRGQERPPLLAG